jgi:hypothetical protein
MSAVMSGGMHTKRYVLRSLALLLALLGAVLFFLESHDFVIRSFGLLAMLASLQLVRMSRARTPSYGRLDLAGSNRPGCIMWIVGIGLLLLAGFSFWLLDIDALHGGHALWPVYLFAGVGLVCGIAWVYIFTKLSA